MGKTIHEILSDPQLLFVRKLQIAAASELFLWEERVDPPNLSILELKRILSLIPIGAKPIWEGRKSTQGKYGMTGERQIFKLDFHVTALGKRRDFFLKGYFFDEGNLRGVEIQSFRRKGRL